MNVWKKLTGRKSTSQSFRKNDRSSESIAVNNRDDRRTEVDEKHLKLLPGEKVVCKTSQIVCSNPFSCTEEDQTGELVLTNFRVTFCPYAQSHSNGPKTQQRNKLIGNNDIALYNIDAVYSVKKKKKKLLQDGLIPRHLKTIEIHCKDFRIHIFHLKLLTERQEAIVMVSSILNGAFPQQMNSLFAFQYSGETSGEDVPRFNTEHEWEELLREKNAIGLFRVVQCNENFRVSDSLPEYFVVPSTFAEHEVVSNIKMFSNNRCPTWSYTHHQTGASLVRMAASIPGIGEELENKMIEHANQCRPSWQKKQDSRTVVTDLTKRLPSLIEVQSSFEALRRLCMPGSLKEFWVTDATWNSSLDSSQWLAFVSLCLSVANEVVANILDAKSVVLKEVDAVDFVPLVSCLAQLILDESTRTINGFQRLIEREWVSLGHRFAERYGKCRNSKSSVRSAIFPLFLDCVYQLVHQFPSSFQFTEYFLVSLYDGVCLGLFRNFLFDSARSSFCTPPKLPSHEVYIARLEPPKLLSIWDWEKQLSDDQIALFFSPQYVFLHDRSIAGQMPHISVSSRGSVLFLNDLDNDKAAQQEAVLTPKVETPHLQLWSLCYLRWLPPSEIIGGGPASDYLSQCVLVEEVLYLQQLVSNLESSASLRRAQNRRSCLIFGSDSNRSFVRSAGSLCISSSFPYAVDRPQLGAGSFIDSYFKNSVMYESAALDELDD